MSAERGRIRREDPLDPKTHEGFMSSLFEETKTMLELSDGTSLVAEIPAQIIEKWGHSLEPEIKLKQGLIFRSDRFDFGVSIGNRGRTVYNDSRPNFEFGLLSHRGQSFDDTIDRFAPFKTRKSRDEKILYYLDGLVHQPEDSGSGFAGFLTDRGTVEVNCWLDKKVHGGKGVNDWVYGTILSQAGLDASLEIISDLIKKIRR